MSDNEFPGHNDQASSSNAGALPARVGVEYVDPNDVTVVDPSNPGDREQLWERKRPQDTERRAEQTVVGMFDQLHQATQVLLHGDLERRHRSGFRAKTQSSPQHRRKRHH